MKNSASITLTTDIGWRYAAQIKGRIYSLWPAAHVVDIAHDITPQNIREAAFVLYTTTPHFADSVHVAVVDPGVGTKREILMIETTNGFLIGPDNGILIPAARYMGMQAVYAFTNNRVLPTNTSPTFHGRDIFAPVAVHLARGAHPSELGSIFHTYENLDFGRPVYGADQVSGEIIYIDKFGNFITNIRRNMVPLSFGEMIPIRIGEFDETIPFVTSYGEVMPNTYLLTVSSSGLFEIACRDQSAFRELEKNVGCEVVIRF